MPAISHKARHPNIIRIRNIHGTNGHICIQIIPNPQNRHMEYSNRLRILKAWAPDIPNNHIARNLSKEFPSQWHAVRQMIFICWEPTEETHSKTIHLPWWNLIPCGSHHLPMVHDKHMFHWNHGAMVDLGKHHLHHCVHYLYLYPCMVDKWETKKQICNDMPIKSCRADSIQSLAPWTLKACSFQWQFTISQRGISIKKNPHHTQTSWRVILCNLRTAWSGSKLVQYVVVTLCGILNIMCTQITLPKWFLKFCVQSTSPHLSHQAFEAWSPHSRPMDPMEMRPSEGHALQHRWSMLQRSPHRAVLCDLKKLKGFLW